MSQPHHSDDQPVRVPVSPDLRRIGEKVVKSLAVPDCSIPFDRLIAKKPAGLVELQKQSFESLCERLLEMGWKQNSLVVNRETMCISAGDAAEQRIIFLQASHDLHVREKFRVHRATLPPDMRIHSLPLDRVGALATLDLQGVAGFAIDETGDFVAISCGVMKLSAWGLTVSKSLGHDSGRVIPAGEVTEPAEPSLSWWKSSLRPLAFDILGCTVDPVWMAGIAVYDATAPQSSKVQEVMTALMEAFVVYHEIGHYERGHGGVYRARGISSEVSCEECYRMEAQADAFALEHLTRLSTIGAAASSVSLVFLLFAMSPDLVRRYPWCPDQPTHPHPLTRLVWLLRRLYPGNLPKQAGYLNLVLETLIEANRDVIDGGVESVKSAMRTLLLSKDPAPDLQ